MYRLLIHTGVFVKVYAVLFFLVFVMIISGCTSYTGDATAEGEEIPEDEINDYAETAKQQTSIKQANPCENLDCGTTKKTCSDGYVALCENKCMEGTCLACLPNCIGHDTETNNTINTTPQGQIPNETANTTLAERDKCVEVVCEDNSLNCPDGFTATCENTCTDGLCSQCEPDCSGHEAIKIIFMQVYYDTPGTESNEEWVELYNPSKSTVDVTGWVISDNIGSWTFPEASINGESYFVVARREEGFKNLYSGCTPDISGFTRGLNNDGDQLTLKDAEGKEMDFVAWEGGADGAYAEWDLETNDTQSIKRTSFTDTDSPSDWTISGDLPHKC